MSRAFDSISDLYYSDSLSRLEEITGTNLARTRLGALLRSLDTLTNLGFDQMDRRLRKRLANAAAEAFAIYDIVTYCPSDFLRSFPEFERIRSGSPEATDDLRSTKGRDKQFELHLAARLFKIGLSVEAKEPDLVVTAGKHQIAVACKRVSRPEALENSVKGAMRQIRRSELPGIIALDMLRVAYPNYELAFANSARIAKAVPFAVLNSISAEYDTIFDRATSANPDGIMVLICLAFPMLYPLFVFDGLPNNPYRLYGYPPRFERAFATKLLMDRSQWIAMSPTLLPWKQTGFARLNTALQRDSAMEKPITTEITAHWNP